MPAGNGSQPDAALIPAEGTKLTLDGKPYTVKAAGKRYVTIAGADGKERVISDGSLMWPKVRAALGDASKKAKKVDTSAQPVQETPKSEQVAANDADAEERALKAGNFKEVIRLRKEREKAERAAVGDITDGVVLRHEEGRRFVMVLPDVDGGGKWRIQRFDAQGFSGHMVFKDQEEALEAALGEGFKTRDDGAMDRMQDTPEWERGMFAADMIQKVNG